MSVEILGTLGEALAVLFPCKCDGSEDFHETRAVESGSRREVRTAEEGLQIVQQESGKGPPSSPRHRTHCIHVGIVDMRKVFPVDLDGDEVLVHECSNGRIRKGFTAHHMTPVTG